MGLASYGPAGPTLGAVDFWNQSPPLSPLSSKLIIKPRRNRVRRPLDKLGKLPSANTNRLLSFLLASTPAKRGSRTVASAVHCPLGHVM